MGRLSGRREREQEQRDEWLSAYLDGELSAEEQTRLEAQLATDLALQAELDALRRTVTLVRDLASVPIPRNFILPQTMAARARPAPALRPRRAWTAPFLTAATAVVSLLFVVVLAGDLLLSGAGRGASEPASAWPVAQIAESEAPREAPAPASVGEQVAVTIEVEAETVFEVEEALGLGAVPTDTLLPMPAEAPPNAEPTATDVAEGYVVEESRDVSSTVPAMGGGGPTVEPTTVLPTPSPTMAEKAEDTSTILSTATAVSRADESDLDLTPREMEKITPSPQAVGEAESEAAEAMPGALESEVRDEYDQPPAETLPWRILEIVLGLVALGLALATIRAWRARHS